jgi:hypothetical protein
MRAGVLALLALFIVSGIVASTSSGAGPYWRVNGTRLEKGAKQLKLQIKGTAVLEAIPSEGEAFEIKCNNSVSEGAAIEGNLANQGQDKGRLIFSSCKTSISTCTVAEPIITNQTKSYLAEASTQTKIVDVFEPTEGTKYVEVKLAGKCGALTIGSNPVTGKVAAEVIPTGVETQEGLLNWPVTPIKAAKHEGAEVKGLELKLATLKATFSGTYAARLEPKEPFGAFLT